MRADSTVQPFTALPSTRTAHAPHCARSQPRLLFCKPSWKFIVSQRLSRLSTTRSYFLPSMSRLTRLIVAATGPPACVVVVVVGVDVAFLMTTTPPRTAPAVAAPAPAPMRKDRRVTAKDLSSDWVALDAVSTEDVSPPCSLTMLHPPMPLVRQKLALGRSASGSAA